MEKSKILLIFLSIISLIGCSVSPEQLGISKVQWNKYSKLDQKRIARNYEYILQTVKKSTFLSHGDSSLKIALQSGHAVMPPFVGSYEFKSTSMEVKEGTCQAITLYAVNANKHTKLYACYNNDVLLLDPSLYEIDKRYGSVRIYCSLLWNDGFTYTGINTDGYAHLQNATVFIKKQKAT